MILTVCANPSIDCTMEVENLNIGMLNRIDSKLEDFSGKGLNVAVAISHLSGDAMATGFMFEDKGKLFEQSLLNEGVHKHKFVWCKGSTRVNYKIIDNRAMLTQINDRGGEVSVKKQNELLDLIGELASGAKVVTVSGSLPRGIDDDFYQKLLKRIPDGVLKLLDCEGDKMKYCFSEGVTLIKPNLYEMETICKRSLLTKAEMLEAAHETVDRGIKYVLLSLGKDGAILTDGSTNYFCKSANVAVNSTSGAGDAMMAAAACALEKGEDMQEILRSGVAAGSATVTTVGTKLFPKDKYDEIYAKLKIERL